MVVKLSSGPSSYIVVAEYKNLTAAEHCADLRLISGDISRKKSCGGLPREPAGQGRGANAMATAMDLDHPELGYMKRLRLRSDGSIVLEVGMYPAAAAQMNAGTTKQ